MSGITLVHDDAGKCKDNLIWLQANSFCQQFSMTGTRIMDQERYSGWIRKSPLLNIFIFAFVMKQK